MRIDNKKIKLELEKMKKQLNLHESGKIIGENLEELNEKQQ